jgi:hypothetical protein
MRERRPWFPHEVTITQSGDGDTLVLAFRHTAEGRRRYREHVLANNLDGWARGGTDTLLRGRDFACDDGWLTAERYPQAESSGGQRRTRLQLGRDADGGLVAGATREVQRSLSVRAGSPGLDLGTGTQTRWRRFPPAAAAATDEPAASERTIDVHRYPWTNRNGAEIVARLDNYTGETVCVRLWDARADSTIPARGAARAAASYAVVRGCPQFWVGLRDLGVYRAALETRAEVRYRIAWRPLDAPTATPVERDLPPPAELPLMPKAR